jgi:hypothetical protein
MHFLPSCVLYFLKSEAEKPKFILLFRHQIPGQNLNIMQPKRYFENIIQEETKRRLNSGNACYNSVQNHLSSCLMSKYVEIKIYKTNFVCSFIWMLNLVSEIKGGTCVAGV